MDNSVRTAFFKGSKSSDSELETLLMSKFSSSEELIFDRWRTRWSVVGDTRESSTTRRNELLRQGVTCVKIRVETNFLLVNVPSSDIDCLLSTARSNMHPQ